MPPNTPDICNDPIRPSAFAPVPGPMNENMPNADLDVSPFNPPDTQRSVSTGVRPLRFHVTTEGWLPHAAARDPPAASPFGPTNARGDSMPAGSVTAPTRPPA